MRTADVIAWEIARCHTVVGRRLIWRCLIVWSLPHRSNTFECVRSDNDWCWHRNCDSKVNKLWCLFALEWNVCRLLLQILTLFLTRHRSFSQLNDFSVLKGRLALVSSIAAVFGGSCFAGRQSGEQQVVERWKLRQVNPIREGRVLRMFRAWRVRGVNEERSRGRLASISSSWTSGTSFPVFCGGEVLAARAHALFLDRQASVQAGRAGAGDSEDCSACSTGFSCWSTCFSGWHCIHRQTRFARSTLSCVIESHDSSSPDQKYQLANASHCL